MISIFSASLISSENHFLLSLNGGLAQLARAPALHAGGHRFESDILHQVRMRRKSNEDQKYIDVIKDEKRV